MATSTTFDFTNKALRKYFPKWLRTHGVHLNILENNMADWHEISFAEELKRTKKLRPMSVVFDLDEVLLSPIHDNGYHDDTEDFQVSDYFPDPREKGTKQWPRQDGLCPPYPGAVPLMEKCQSLGMAIFYVTARPEAMRETTIMNLKVCNLPTQGTQLFMRPKSDRFTTAHDWKEDVRRIISEDFRIVANVGDQVSDMGKYGDIHYLIPHHFYTVIGN